MADPYYSTAYGAGPTSASPEERLAALESILYPVPEDYAGMRQPVPGVQGVRFPTPDRPASVVEVPIDPYLAATEYYREAPTEFAGAIAPEQEGIWEWRDAEGRLHATNRPEEAPEGATFKPFEKPSMVIGGQRLFGEVTPEQIEVALATEESEEARQAAAARAAAEAAPPTYEQRLATRQQVISNIQGLLNRAGSEEERRDILRQGKQFMDLHGLTRIEKPEVEKVTPPKDLKAVVARQVASKELTWEQGMERLKQLGGSEKDVKDFESSQKLRKEYLAGASDFTKTRDSFARIQAVGKTATGAGDLALIFNYMKLLDPGSVVRESEFRTAEQAKAWLSEATESGVLVPSSIRTAIQKADPAKRGAFLLDNQREDFVARARDLFKKQSDQHKKRVGSYTKLATSFGLSPEDVVIDLTDPETLREAGLAEEEIPEAQAATAEAAGAAPTPAANLAKEFPGREAQIQQALDAGYGEDEIRAFLGGR